MDMITDFILLAASGAAVFYCIMLNQKLEKLKSRENGLGATIASMSQTVDQAREAVTLARAASQENIQTLGPLVEETRDLIPQLSELIDVVSELADIAINDINAAGSDAADRLAARIDEARQTSAELRRDLDALSIEFSEAGHPSPQEENIAYIDEVDTPLEPTSRVAAAISAARGVRPARKAAG